MAASSATRPSGNNLGYAHPRTAVLHATSPHKNSVGFCYSDPTGVANRRNQPFV